LQVWKEQFYDTKYFSIVPMAFCYPGKGKSGDLPPPPKCAETWMQPILDKVPERRLTLLIGQYAQVWFLQSDKKATLTETVKTGKSINLNTLFCHILRPAIISGLRKTRGSKKNCCRNWQKR
jgi:uracil-DNA glycosylase